MMHQLLPIQQAALILGYKDKRSAEEWCRLNGVHVKSDKKRKFVIQKDLESAMELIFIESLEKRYPHNYEEIYTALKNNDMINVYKLTKGRGVERISESVDYVPKGSFAKKFSQRKSI